MITRLEINSGVLNKMVPGIPYGDTHFWLSVKTSPKSKLASVTVEYFLADVLEGRFDKEKFLATFIEDQKELDKQVVEKPQVSKDCNEYGVPLHACNGHIQNEHYWAYIKEKSRLQNLSRLD